MYHWEIHSVKQICWYNTTVESQFYIYKNIHAKILQHTKHDSRLLNILQILHTHIVHFILVPVRITSPEFHA